MRQRTVEKPKTEEKTERISMRLEEPFATLLNRVQKASKRTKTSIIEECLERALPALERQLSKAA